MHCHSRAFTEGYASVPKYTLRLESSAVKFLVFHLRDLAPFLIRLSRAFTFHNYFIFFLFHFMQPYNKFLFFLIQP